MIRSLTTITRSTIAAAGSILSPDKARQLNGSSNSIKARSFNTHHQAFPYHGEPVGRFQPDQSPRHYGVGHQVSPDFGQFRPGVNWRDPRLGFQFRGEYGPYPVGLVCRFCGCQQFVPVRHGGNWGWNPNVGGFRGGVAPGNGFVDHGVGYDRDGWPPMRNDYIRNNAGPGGNFDGRSFGYENLNRSYGENVSNEGWGRDWNVNPNVEQLRKDFGDGRYERRGEHQVNGAEEQKISHDGYRQSQDGYRWRNQNFVGNGGREGRDGDGWSQSRSTYNGYGPEHGVQQGNGNARWDQTRLGYNGGNGGGQPQNRTVDERQMNLNGASQGYQQARQGPRMLDVQRNGSYHGSDERNWRSSSHSSSDYNRAWVRGSNGHENLNRPYDENLNVFQRNTNMSHGQNWNVNPDGGQYQKSSNATNNGEAGRLFQENKVVKQDGVNAGYEQQTRDMRNLYDPLPEFAANEPPANPNGTSAQNSRMPNVKDKGVEGGLPQAEVLHSNNVARGSKDAAGRCQRIIDVLENEDNRRLREGRPVSQSRNEHTASPVGNFTNSNGHDWRSHNENRSFSGNSSGVQPDGAAYHG
uniref:Uncharacterized protein n=1 Tax=Kalanchoe fedtschenkoi TaxID=63787 RepID=A0A7N0TCB1_KALFE